MAAAAKAMDILSQRASQIHTRKIHYRSLISTSDSWALEWHWVGPTQTGH